MCLIFIKLKNNLFFQFHDEGFEIPPNSDLLATGDRFKNQAFKYKNCYGFQFHPEVNFYLHLRWLFFILIYNPKKLFVKGAQNILIQLFFRFRYNKTISLWLDDFLDNYLLKNINFKSLTKTKTFLQLLSYIILLYIISSIFF